MRSRAVAAFLALLACGAVPREGAHEGAGSSLQARLARMAKTAPGACLIAVRHLESGRVAEVRAHERCPMGSVYKLPIAIAVLRAVDEHRLTPFQPVRLLAREMNPGASRLGERYPAGGVSLPLHDLLVAMLVESDNTAADALQRVLGGSPAVQLALTAMHVAGMRVDRTELVMGNDGYGLVPPAPQSTWTRAKMRAWRDAVPPAARLRASRAFSRDPRDSATPAALVELLVRARRGELLSRAGTDTLFAILSRCATGAARLPAGFPPPSIVAHRTGTGVTTRGLTPCVNDVALVTLPGGGGHVAIAVMVRDARGPVAGAERTIAGVARAVFDTWNAPD